MSTGKDSYQLHCELHSREWIRMSTGKDSAQLHCKLYSREWISKCSSRGVICNIEYMYSKGTIHRITCLKEWLSLRNEIGTMLIWRA